MAGTVFITCPPSPTPTAALSFAHTQPGVQSELYLDVRAAPGVQVVATASGPGMQQTTFGKTDATGRLRLIWVITELGTYRATGTVGGAAISAQVEVR